MGDRKCRRARRLGWIERETQLYSFRIDGRRGYLNHLVVDEGHRRLGVGRRLAELALAGLEKEGIYKCHLFILPDNLDAKAYWRRLGWIERETQLYSYHIGGRLNP